MRKIETILGLEEGRPALVVGAGSSIKDNQNKIDIFIKETNPFIIGVNNMVGLWVPDYHVWTNNQRLRDFGKNINKKSTVLLGSNISSKSIKGILDNINYVVLTRVDRKGIKIGFKEGIIYGYFRTAGNLSIMLAHLMGAKEINVIGLDGYSFHNKTDIKSGKKSQHCYGSGFTDTDTWEECVEKDKNTNDILNKIKEYGIDFKILTPTKYEAFYDSTRLHA